MDIGAYWEGRQERKKEGVEQDHCNSCLSNRSYAMSTMQDNTRMS